MEIIHLFSFLFFLIIILKSYNLTFNLEIIINKFLLINYIHSYIVIIFFNYLLFRILKLDNPSMKKLRFTLIVNRIVKNSQDFSQECKTHFTSDLHLF